MLGDEPEKLPENELELDALEGVTGGTGSNSEEAGMEGTVIAALPNALFSVDVGGQMITAHVSGQLRQHYFRILLGDKVQVEGNRITYCYK